MLTFLFLAAIAAVFGLIVHVNNQGQIRRLQQLGGVACNVCGVEGVTERGGGSYACGSCGYDTDTEQTPERARLLKEIQDLAIAISCLENADTEFHESRHRIRKTNRNGRKSTENVGPYHDRYLEGIEQAEEASRILEHQVDDRPTLGPAIDALSGIPIPADGREGFNVRVTESKDCLQVALGCTAKVRAEMVASFRK
ncbi:MAG: chromosome segregation ATPase [Myxococcota bacterium]|jgi:chromosome segregation ATPase